MYEVSANFWEYPAQRLGTIFVDAEPTPLYRELLDDSRGDLRRGGGDGCAPARPPPSCGRRRAAITIRDDLVHGFVGGYLPPVLGARQPIPDFTFEAGMTVVVQPNVVTPDERAGVQVGELLLVTDDGAERLHG